MNETRGQPRIQYDRTYILLPPQAGREWLRAVIKATWDDHRYTVGGSADDAGVGDLDVRRVIAINPHWWGDDLCAWFEEHYPGVMFVPVECITPALMARALEGL